jgi:hypothetical protein
LAYASSRLQGPVGFTYFPAECLEIRLQSRSTYHHPANYGRPCSFKKARQLGSHATNLIPTRLQFRFPSQAQHHLYTTDADHTYNMRVDWKAHQSRSLDAVRHDERSTFRNISNHGSLPTSRYEGTALTRGSSAFQMVSRRKIAEGHFAWSTGYAPS